MRVLRVGRVWRALRRELFLGLCLVAAALVMGGTTTATALASSPYGAVGWGWNELGQLGNGRTENSPVPVAVDNVSEVHAVAAG
jgi:alpha-tubulin suppressor-like RCC1 family protein